MERYRVGSLTIDADRGTVEGPDGRIDLYGRTIGVLIELVRAAPGVCRRQDLIDRVWRDTFVGDQNLNQRIYQLRSALGPAGVAIDTVRGTGYRLTTPVERVSWMEAASSEHDAEALRLLAAGVEMFDAMDHGKSAVLLEAARDSDPRWATPRTFLAWAYMWLERLPEARRELEEARRLTGEAGGPEQLFVDATYAAFAGDAVGAIERIEVLLEQEGGFYWLRVYLAELYQIVGRLDDAERVIADLERLRPGFYVNMWMRGLYLMFEQGDLAGAAADLAIVSEQMPGLSMPLADMAPALAAWEKGRLDAALEDLDRLFVERFDGLFPVGKSQFLLLRSRLLADRGDEDAARHDVRLGAALFDPGASFHVYHTMEEALLLRNMGDDRGTEMLNDLTEVPSALYRAQAFGWLAVDAARHDDLEEAGRLARRLRDITYDHGWEWGFPTRPGFERASLVFPMLVDGWTALARDDPERAVVMFGRARRAAPERMTVVPTVSLGGRAHVDATEGLALAYGALGEADHAGEADLWLARHRLETVILTQAGAGYLRRAEARLSGQPEGTTSAAPMAKSNGPVVVPE